MCARGRRGVTEVLLYIARLDDGVSHRSITGTIVAFAGHSRSNLCSWSAKLHVQIHSTAAAEWGPCVGVL